MFGLVQAARSVNLSRFGIHPHTWNRSMNIITFKSFLSLLLFFIVSLFSIKTRLDVLDSQKAQVIAKGGNLSSAQYQLKK